MTTTYRLLAGMLAGGLLIAGCSGDGGDETASTKPAAASTTLVSCGREIDLASVDSVYLLFHTPIELALTLGADKERLVGAAYLDNALPDDLPNIADIVPYVDGYPSKEQVLEADPDLIYASFASAYKDEKLGSREALADLGIQTYQSPQYCDEVEEFTMETLYNEVRNAGLLLDRTDAAEEFIDKSKATIDEVTKAVADVEPKTVLALELYESKLSGRGGSGMLNHLIELAGGKNVFADVDDDYFSTNREEVIAKDPDVLVVYTCCGSDLTDEDAKAALEELKTDPALAAMRAIKENQVFFVVFSETNISPRNPDTVRRLAESLHPEAFKG